MADRDVHVHIVVDMLRMAVTGRRVRTGAVLHSDSWKSLHINTIPRVCRVGDAWISVGRTGARWDSAAVESLFATLRNEIYHLQALGAGNGSRSPGASKCPGAEQTPAFDAWPSHSTEAFAEYRNAASVA